MRSIFKLTDHLNKFFLFSRDYKYNLQREYSRSLAALTVPRSYFTLPFFFSSPSLWKNWNLRGKSFLLGDRSFHRFRFLRYEADKERVSIAGAFVLLHFIFVHRTGKMHFPVVFPAFAYLLIEPWFAVTAGILDRHFIFRERNDDVGRRFSSFFFWEFGIFSNPPGERETFLNTFPWMK